MSSRFRVIAKNRRFQLTFLVRCLRIDGANVSNVFNGFLALHLTNDLASFLDEERADLTAERAALQSLMACTSGGLSELHV